MLRHTLAIVLILAIATLALSACSPAATPTVDANTAFTQVAGTVQAELTRAVTQAPTATFTTQPTETQSPTEGPTIAPTATGPTATVMPVFTATKPPSPDKAEFVSQSVADDTQMDPGQKFTITWTIKNVGTSTWTTAFLLRYYSGDQMGAPATVTFPKEVKPNDTVELSVNMTAPAVQGQYLSNWVLTNNNGVNFYPLFIQIKVGNPPTATPTSAASTATSTSPAAVPSATSSGS